MACGVQEVLGRGRSTLLRGTGREIPEGYPFLAIPGVALEGSS